jgi:PIN domain nuclease of toxin-antitoxin system
LKRDKTQRAFELISDQDTEIFVSAGTLWEIAIKYALKRHRDDEVTISSTEADSYFRGAGYRLLDIAPAHVIAVGSLPRLHGDPFDRIRIAQSLTEPLHLLTHDATVARYSGMIIEV